MDNWMRRYFLKFRDGNLVAEESDSEKSDYCIVLRCFVPCIRWNLTDGSEKHVNSINNIEWIDQYSNVKADDKPNNLLNSKSKVMSRPTVSRQVCLVARHPSRSFHESPRYPRKCSKEHGPPWKHQTPYCTPYIKHCSQLSSLQSLILLLSLSLLHRIGP
jgi:hypothetical protein